MAIKPNLKTLATFLLGAIAVISSFVTVNAADLTIPKTVNLGDVAEISVNNPDAAETNLEVTLSSRSIPDPQTVKVPANGKVEFKNLPEGVFIVTLGRTGVRRPLRSGSFRVMEVLK